MQLSQKSLTKKKNKIPNHPQGKKILSREWKKKPAQKLMRAANMKSYLIQLKQGLQGNQ